MERRVPRDDSYIPQNFDRDFPEGALCACKCGCSCPLGDGNVMGELLVAAEVEWNGKLGDPIVLVLCIDCYVGSHRRPFA